jgi:isoleucyl-tRNA synthetase
LERSVQLAAWPEPSRAEDAGLVTKWERICAIRQASQRALEAAKEQGLAPRPLEAALDVYCGTHDREVLESLEDQLCPTFIVSEVRLHEWEQAPVDAAVRMDGLAISARAAEGAKCARCWMITRDVGQVAEHPTICQRCARHIGALSS